MPTDIMSGIPVEVDEAARTITLHLNRSEQHEALLRDLRERDGGFVTIEGSPSIAESLAQATQEFAWATARPKFVRLNALSEAPDQNKEESRKGRDDGDDLEMTKKQDGDLARKMELEKAMAYAKDREYQRQSTANVALDHLQWLAYVTARRDVPHDLNEGVAVLDPVFAIIRQVCGLESVSKGDDGSEVDR